MKKAGYENFIFHFWIDYILLCFHGKMIYDWHVNKIQRSDAFLRVICIVWLIHKVM